MVEIRKVSQLDPDFACEISSHRSAHAVSACFACGTCLAGCPIHRIYPEYNPRKIVRMIQLGMRKEVLESKYIWYCTTCHTCEERCPQEVKFFNVLNVLKNIAATEGYAPSPWIEQTKQVMKTGMTIPLEETWIKKRAELSLRPLKGEGAKAAQLIQLAGLDKILAGG
jgi:heterodisulfide reductase subunit C